MRNRLMIGAAALTMFLLSACGTETTSTNTTNGNTAASAESTIETAEYVATTRTDGGVTTETRVYRNNPRVSKIIVTTRDGKKSVRVVSASGEERELRDDVEAVLRKTGTEIADAAGFIADKAEDVGGKAADVGREAADKGEDVLEQTGKGAKAVGGKAAEGAKKTGKAIKDAVTP